MNHHQKQRHLSTLSPFLLPFLLLSSFSGETAHNQQQQLRLAVPGEIDGAAGSTGEQQRQQLRTSSPNVSLRFFFSGENNNNIKSIRTPTGETLVTTRLLRSAQSWFLSLEFKVLLSRHGRETLAKLNLFNCVLYIF